MTWNCGHPITTTGRRCTCLRNANMAAMYSQGESIDAIEWRCAITRERVRQILGAHGIKADTTGRRTNAPSSPVDELIRQHGFDRTTCANTRSRPSGQS